MFTLWPDTLVPLHLLPESLRPESLITPPPLHDEEGDGDGEGDAEWTTVAITDPTDRSRQFSGLRIGRQHEFQIQAINEAGSGPYSASGTITVAGVPDAISIIRVSQSGSTVTLTWTPPGANHGTLSGYRVEYRRDTNQWPRLAHSGLGTTITVSDVLNLSIGSTYAFRVRAINEAGHGAWPLATPSFTYAAVPAAPAAPLVTQAGTTLTVTWVAPDANSAAITDYDVRYRESGDMAWTDHAHTGTVLTTTVTGLTVGVTYEFQVRAENRIGESDWSASRVVTVAGVPGRVATPTVTQNADAITVTWGQPNTNHGAIRSYDVLYRRIGATQWRTPSDTPGTQRTLTIRNLTLGQQYEVQVRAQNTAGRGAWSASATLSVHYFNLNTLVGTHGGCYRAGATGTPNAGGGAFAQFTREDDGITTEYQIVTYGTDRHIRSRLELDTGTWSAWVTTIPSWVTSTDADDVLIHPQFIPTRNAANVPSNPTSDASWSNTFFIVMHPVNKTRQAIHQFFDDVCRVWNRDYRIAGTFYRWGVIRAATSGTVRVEAVYRNRILLPAADYTVQSITKSIDGQDLVFQFVELDAPIPDDETPEVSVDLTSTEFSTSIDAARFLLEDAQYGLGEPVAAADFTTASQHLADLGYGLEFGVYDPQSVQDLLLDLLVRGVRLSRNATQQWTVEVDQASIHPAAPVVFRQGGSGIQTIIPGTVTRKRGGLRDVVNTVKILFEHDYGFGNDDQYLASVEAKIEGVVGSPETIENPFLDEAGARREAGYLLEVLRAHNRVVSLSTDLRGLLCALDARVQVHVPHRRIDGEYMVRAVDAQWSGEEGEAEITATHDFELIPYAATWFTRRGDVAVRLKEDPFGMDFRYTRPHAGTNFTATQTILTPIETQVRLSIQPPSRNRTTVRFGIFLTGENQAVPLDTQDVDIDSSGIISADFILSPGTEVDFQAIIINTENAEGYRSSTPSLITDQTVIGNPDALVGRTTHSHSIALETFNPSADTVLSPVDWNLPGGQSDQEWPESPVLSVFGRQSDQELIERIEPGGIVTLERDAHNRAHYRTGTITGGGTSDPHALPLTRLDTVGQPKFSTGDGATLRMTLAGKDGKPGLRGLAGYSHSVTLTNFQPNQGNVNADEEWWMTGGTGNTWPSSATIVWREDETGKATQARLITVGSLLTVFKDLANWSDYQVTSVSVSGNIVTVMANDIESVGKPAFSTGDDVAIHFNPKGEEGVDGLPGLRGLQGYSHRVEVTNLVQNEGDVNADEEWWFADHVSDTWPTAGRIIWQENDAGRADEAKLIQIGSLFTVFQDATNWADYRVTSRTVTGTKVELAGTLIDAAGGPDFLPGGTATQRTVAVHFNPKGEKGEDGVPGLRGFAGYSHSITVTDLVQNEGDVDANNKWWFADHADSTWPTAGEIVWQRTNVNDVLQASLVQVGGLLTVWQDATNWADYRVTTRQVSGTKATIHGTLIDAAGGPDFAPDGLSSQQTIEIRITPKGANGRDGLPGLRGLQGYSHRVEVTNLVQNEGDVNADEEWWFADHVSDTWPTAGRIIWQENDAGRADEAKLIQIGSLFTVFQDATNWADYRVTSRTVTGTKVELAGTLIDAAGGPDFLPGGTATQRTVAVHFNPKGEKGEDGVPGLRGFAGYSHSITVTDLVQNEGDVDANNKWWFADHADSTWPTAGEIVWQRTNVNDVLQASLVQVGGLLTVWQDATNWADYRVTTRQVSGTKATIHGTLIDAAGGPDFAPDGLSSQQTIEIRITPKGANGRDGLPGLRGLQGYSHRVEVTNLVQNEGDVNADEEWWFADHASDTWPTTGRIIWQENDAGRAGEAKLIQIGSLFTVFQDATNWADYRVTSRTVTGTKVELAGTLIDAEGGPDFLPGGTATQRTVAVHFNPKARDGTRSPGRFSGVVTAKPDDDAAWASAASTVLIAHLGSGATPVIGDAVTLLNEFYVETRYYNGTTWGVTTEYIDGSLMVRGSLSASALNTDVLVIGGDVHPVGLQINNSADIVMKMASDRSNAAALRFQRSNETDVAQLNYVEYSLTSGVVYFIPSETDSTGILAIGFKIDPNSDAADTNLFWKDIQLRAHGSILLDAPTIAFDGVTTVRGLKPEHIDGLKQYIMDIADTGDKQCFGPPVPGEVPGPPTTGPGPGPPVTVPGRNIGGPPVPGPPVPVWGPGPRRPFTRPGPPVPGQVPGPRVGTEGPGPPVPGPPVPGPPVPGPPVTVPGPPVPNIPGNPKAGRKPGPPVTRAGPPVAGPPVAGPPVAGPPVIRRPYKPGPPVPGRVPGPPVTIIVPGPRQVIGQRPSRKPGPPVPGPPVTVPGPPVPGVTVPGPPVPGQVPGPPIPCPPGG